MIYLINWNHHDSPNQKSWIINLPAILNIIDDHLLLMIILISIYQEYPDHRMILRIDPPVPVSPLVFFTDASPSPGERCVVTGRPLRDLELLIGYEVRCFLFDINMINNNVDVMNRFANKSLECNATNICVQLYMHVSICCWCLYVWMYIFWTFEVNTPYVVLYNLIIYLRCEYDKLVPYFKNYSNTNVYIYIRHVWIVNQNIFCMMCVSDMSFNMVLSENC